MALTLPQELLQAILDDIPTMDDLLRFCLVARCLRDPSQQRIFHTVQLGRSLLPEESTNRWNAFVQAVKASPHLASYVRTIHIAFVDNPDADSIAHTLFSEALPISMGIEKLVVEFAGSPHADLSVLATQMLHPHPTKPISHPSLRFMYISGTKSLPLSLLLSLPNLKSMVLKAFKDTQAVVPTSRPRYTQIVLPETLMLAPYELPPLLELCQRLLPSRAKASSGVDLSKLRSLLLQLPYDPHLHRFLPDAFISLQMFLEAVSQHLVCLEISLEDCTAFRFCGNPRSLVLQLPNLKRLSVILDVYENIGVDVRGVEALISWVKAITVCRDFEEFYLSLRQEDEIEGESELSDEDSDDEGNEDEEENDDGDDDDDRDDDGNGERDIHTWHDLIQETIMPSLLDLEAHFTSGDHFNQPPHVKISIKGGMEADLNYVKSSLARLEMSGLDVIRKGQYLGSSGILDTGTISMFSDDALKNENR